MKINYYILVIIFFKLNILFAQNYSNLNTFNTYTSNNNQPFSPSGIHIANNGFVYLVEQQNHRIQILTQSGNNVGLYASFGTQGTGNNQFNTPVDIATDSQGKIYVADYSNHRIQILTQSGTNIGYYSTFGSVQGSGANQLNSPWSVSIDNNDMVYIADMINNRIQVLTSNGTNFGLFTSFGGTQGNGNDQLYWPQGICIGNNGKVYVTDFVNKRLQVLTIVGNSIGIYATYNYQIQNIRDVAVDNDEKIYLITAGSSIKVITQNGTNLGLYTVFGNHGNSQNQLDNPLNINISNENKIFISDSYNNRISVWAQPTPTNLTLSGLGTFIYSGASFAATGSTTVPGMVPEIKYNGSLTPPTNVGTYAVTSKTVYFYNGENFIAEGSGTLTIVPSAQTIAGFSLPSSVVLGASPIVLGLSSNSSLPVSYATTGNVLVQNNTLYFHGVGAASVTASQIGDANYLSANNVVHLLTVTTPIITVVSPPVTVTSTPVTVTSAPITVTSAPITVTSAPITVTSAPITVTSAPITVTSAPITVTSAPITVTSINTVTVTSIPITVTSAPITVTSAPITVTSINTVTVTSIPITVTSAPITVTSINTVTVTSVITTTSCLNSTTGINENAVVAEVKFQPNPTRGVVLITTTNVVITHIEIYNSLGAKVQDLPFDGVSIDISSLPVGMYMLRMMNTTDEVLNKKIILKQ
ncbi:MAG: hypothetical protein EAZ53_12250 [Bacteroidetes bacterium]|nr:MAG: hypothetical protein EAZ53_12250 [Bacteroidota bacterium]